jgi:steroid 5-alpha reductase family enzyme
VLPLRAVENRTILDTSIAGGNYFFEWCVWIGYAVYGFAFGAWGLIALVPQAIILASIFGVTGIPPTENQAIRSKGDAYRQYQKRVAKFVPWPPKRR